MAISLHVQGQLRRCMGYHIFANSNCVGRTVIMYQIHKYTKYSNRTVLLIFILTSALQMLASATPVYVKCSYMHADCNSCKNNMQDYDCIILLVILQCGCRLSL